MASGLHLARFRCTECGECCRVHPVPITHHDLVRLVRATGLAADALVELAGVNDVDLSGEPGTFALLDSGRRAMLLRREAGACSLLSGERCSVHAARPTACRAYPLHASFGKRGGVRRLRVLRGVDCPFELGAVGSLAEVRRDQLRLQRELQEYQAQLALWNRRQRHRQRLGKALHGVRELFVFLGAIQSDDRSRSMLRPSSSSAKRTSSETSDR